MRDSSESVRGEFLESHETESKNLALFSDFESKPETFEIKDFDFVVRQALRIILGEVSSYKWPVVILVRQSLVKTWTVAQ